MRKYSLGIALAFAILSNFSPAAFAQTAPPPKTAAAASGGSGARLVRCLVQ